MPFDSPTIAELREQARADVAAKLGLGPLLPKSVLGVLADVEAALAFGVHEHLVHVAKQSPPREESDSESLDEWGLALGIPRDQPQPASGDVLFSGTNSTVVPAGTALARADGAQFALAADLTLGPGPTAGVVQALEAGPNGNTPAATELSFTSPIAGVNSTAEVDVDGLTGGTPLQSDASYLAELRDRLSNPPLGGAVADYVLWAKEVPGVTRVFPQPALLGLGTVGVVILADDDPSGPIPPPSLVTAVQDLLDDGFHAPVGVAVTVYAPIAVPLDPTIELIGIDTAAVRAAVAANLESLLRSGLRNDGTAVNAPGATIPLSLIREAISTAPGEDDHDLTLPAADVVLADGEIAVLGTITWV